MDLWHIHSGVVICEQQVVRTRYDCHASNMWSTKSWQCADIFEALTQDPEEPINDPPPSIDATVPDQMDLNLTQRPAMTRQVLSLPLLPNQLKRSLLRRTLMMLLSLGRLIQRQEPPLCSPSIVPKKNHLHWRKARPNWICRAIHHSVQVMCTRAI